MVKTVWIRQLIKRGDQFLFHYLHLYLLYIYFQNTLEENKRQQFWFCCHMLSGNCQAVHISIVVDTGKAGIHYSKYGHAWQLSDNIWQQNQNCRLLFSNYNWAKPMPQYQHYFQWWDRQVKASKYPDSIVQQAYNITFLHTWLNAFTFRYIDIKVGDVASNEEFSTNKDRSKIYQWTSRKLHQCNIYIRKIRKQQGNIAFKNMKR